jgi:hypothetical protein
LQEGQEEYQQEQQYEQYQEEQPAEESGYSGYPQVRALYDYIAEAETGISVCLLFCHIELIVMLQISPSTRATSSICWTTMIPVAGGRENTMEQKDFSHPTLWKEFNSTTRVFDANFISCFCNCSSEILSSNLNWNSNKSISLDWCWQGYNQFNC